VSDIEKFSLEYLEEIKKLQDLKKEVQNVNNRIIQLQVKYNKKGVNTKIVIKALDKLKNDMKPKYCQDCKVQITDDNIYPSQKKFKKVKCKKCFNKMAKRSREKRSREKRNELRK